MRAWRGPRGSLGRASMEIHAFRLTPGQDLKKSLLAYAKGAKLEAGCIVTCVGSLSKVRVRHRAHSPRRQHPRDRARHLPTRNLSAPVPAPVS